MKGVFVILDGVADRPCRALGQITPLQAAKTPNLDSIAGESKIDYCYTVKKDFVPESNEGVISLLGYDYLDVSRGTLEALGLGVNLKAGDLALRCNFATLDDESGEILDRRAGRTLTTKEARILAKAINEKVKLPYKFEFYPGIQHRAVLVIRGGFSNNITDVGQSSNGKVEFSRALDEDENSVLASEVLNRFVRRSHEILDKHPVNSARARKGLYSANFLLCRGAGNELPRFKKLKGKWMALGYMPLEKGIAKAMKMELYNFKYPKLKGIDVYSNLFSGLNLAIKNSIRMLKRNKKKYDYFYIHFKETDLPGHDNKPYEKVKMIELLDRKFFGFLKKFVEREKARLVVTADHTTACVLKAHSEDPVPLLSYPHHSGKKEEKRFTEEEGLKGKRIFGRKVLEEKMFRM